MKEVLEALAAGGDTAMIAAAYFLIKHEIKINQLTSYTKAKFAKVWAAISRIKKPIK